MLCDIHFICFGQQTPTPPYEVNGVHVVSEMEDVVDAKRYCRIAPFFSNLPGIHYTLLLEEGKWDDGSICWTTHGIFDSDFNRHPEAKRPPWIRQAHYDDMTPIVCESEEIYEAIREILLRQIYASPIKTVVFKARYEAMRETFVGPIQHGMFMKLMKKKEIYFNVCYIITI